MNLKEAETNQYVLFCDGAHCKKNGAAKVRKALRKAAKKEETPIGVGKMGCIGQCGKGPNAMVLPQGVCCTRLDADDGEKILDLFKEKKGKGKKKKH